MGKSTSYAGLKVRAVALSGFVLGICLLMLQPRAQAHHPVQAKFNESRPVILSGRVTEIDWANPHVHIFINVGGSDGRPVNWAVEIESPIELERSGWTAESVAIGDIITVQGPAAINGSDQVWGRVIRNTAGEAVYAVDPNALQARLQERPDGQTPRWPDGQPRLGPPPGQTGYWTSPGLNSLVEDGAQVQMDAHGLLDNIDDASRVAPFQAWARDLYVLRQSNYLKDDPMFLYCIPPGGPRQLQVPFGVQFVEQRDRERIFVLMGAGNSNWRLIYTDGRAPQGQVSGDDENPLFYGRSVAQWEGDTLVINSTGFNEGFWFSNGGLPHTGLLQMEERISRPDLNTLNYEVTVDDPGAYTRPWTSSWTLQWLPGEELPEYYCQDNRP
ncbi:MAG: DUF6152 family protein [Pseudohongiellaceae bacterium]